VNAEDRAQIAELLVRYAHCCDDRDFDGAGECFTADAQAEYSGVRLPRGVAHIVAHLQPLANLPLTQHIVGSVSVRPDGDGATSRSYVVAHLVRSIGDGHEVVHRGLRYDDRLVRTADGWRIADRLHRVLWSTTEPTVWPVPRFTATPPADH
jgi:3-phenylpropionate/cinnamic acid dioxygenase small subunit